MTLAVYVAGSSDELDRARAAMAMLRADGIEVTSTWPDAVAKAGGVGNPRDATREQRLAWKRADIAQVEAANVVWMLAPRAAPGRGAYWECGVADAHGLTIVASGDTKQSIFLAEAHEFADDIDAALFILHLARTR